MQRFLKVLIGNASVGDGRIEGGNLIIRLPADFPPDFRGQVSVQFESTKPCGCLDSEACSHDHSGCGTPCGPDCDANIVAVATPRMDMDDNCDLPGEPCTLPGVCGEGVTECTGDNAVQCSTNHGGGEAATGICNGLDDDCDGTVDETCEIGECPAQPAT